MRKRKQIEDDYEESVFVIDVSRNQKLILEVCLDIRDLLIHYEKKKKY